MTEALSVRRYQIADRVRAVGVFDQLCDSFRLARVSKPCGVIHLGCSSFLGNAVIILYYEDRRDYPTKYAGS